MGNIASVTAAASGRNRGSVADIAPPQALRHVSFGVDRASALSDNVGEVLA